MFANARMQLTEALYFYGYTAIAAAACVEQLFIHCRPFSHQALFGPMPPGATFEAAVAANACIHILSILKNNQITKVTPAVTQLIAHYASVRENRNRNSHHQCATNEIQVGSTWLRLILLYLLEILLGSHLLLKRHEFTFKPRTNPL